MDKDEFLDKISKFVFLDMFFRLKKELNYYILYSKSIQYKTLFRDNLSLLTMNIDELNASTSEFVTGDCLNKYINNIVDILYNIGYYKMQIYKKMYNKINVISGREEDDKKQEELVMKNIEDILNDFIQNKE